MVDDGEAGGGGVEEGQTKRQVVGESGRVSKPAPNKGNVAKSARVVRVARADAARFFYNLFYF